MHKRNEVTTLKILLEEKDHNKDMNVESIYMAQSSPFLIVNSHIGESSKIVSVSRLP